MKGHGGADGASPSVANIGALRPRGLIVAALVASAWVCGTGAGDGAPALVAVLRAFPAESAPLVAQSAIDGTVEIEGRVFRRGMLKGLPFIAFRSVSDGARGPLGLPGFPAEFFVYHRLAAGNAAAPVP